MVSSAPGNSVPNTVISGLALISIRHQVTSPLLKLFAELVQNRSQRLQFDSTSPNGVLLFREASKVLCSYGKSIIILRVLKIKYLIVLV